MGVVGVIGVPVGVSVGVCVAGVRGEGVEGATGVPVGAGAGTPVGILVGLAMAGATGTLVGLAVAGATGALVGLAVAGATGASVGLAVAGPPSTVTSTPSNAPTLRASPTFASFTPSCLPAIAAVAVNSTSIGCQIVGHQPSPPFTQCSFLIAM